MIDLLIASVDYFPNVGGISMMTHHLANGFSDAGVSTRVLVPSDDNRLQLEQRYSLVVDRDARPNARESWAWTNEQLPRLTHLFRQIHDECQYRRILLTHPFYYGPAALNLGKERAVPVSVVFHGFELRSQLVLGARISSIVRRFRGDLPTLRQTTLAFARDVNEILTNSTYTARLVRRTGTRAPIKVIGCGLSEEDIDGCVRAFPCFDLARKQQLRSELGLPKEKTLVGTMCRLVESKNVEMLVRAIARAPHLHGVVIGIGPQLKPLQSLAHSLGVDRRISWFGDVEEHKKWRLLASLDAFCLLSRQTSNGQVEGFGIVLLEAAAAGTPVIATDSGGIPDAVQPERTGLRVPVGDVGQLLRCIDRYRSEPEFAARMVGCARALIRDRFNWPTIARKLAIDWGLLATQRSGAPISPDCSQ